MRNFVFALLACLTSPGLASYAQKSGATRIPTPVVTGQPLAAFRLAHYDTLAGGRATGDLNRDGLPDVALVLAPPGEDTVALGSGAEQLPPRLLLVLLRAPGGGYRLAARTARVVLGKGDGGCYDPFGQLSIERGVVVLDQVGGGSQRWWITSKFRCQQGRFYVIGETTGTAESYQPCPNETSEDANFITGICKSTTTTSTCEELVKRYHCRRRPLRPLATYVVKAPY